jgi:hypothetical protein
MQWHAVTIAVADDTANSYRLYKQYWPIGSLANNRSINFRHAMQCHYIAVVDDKANSFKVIHGYWPIGSLANDRPIYFMHAIQCIILRLLVTLLIP